MDTKIRVLIVDDSAFFRRRIDEILLRDPAIEVIGHAIDGRAGVEAVKKLRPDVVIMDVEMPVLDGIGAVKRIMKECPTAILMFSSLTYQGAKATLDALDAGAVDFLPKQFDTNNTQGVAANALLQRIHGIAGAKTSQKLPLSHQAPRQRPLATTASVVYPDRERYKLVAIGASTGGPVAIKQLLMTLTADFPLPLLVVVHMPASFTPAFAERLDEQCSISVKEAVDGDVLQPSQAYLAPGGKQMLLEKQGGRTVIRTKAGEANLIYNPSVDISWGSAARLFPGGVLAIVLTGMGSDGAKAAKLLKQGGSTVWSQDEESCVVYGMPRAVDMAGLSDKTMSLSDIGPMLSRAV